MIGAHTAFGLGWQPLLPLWALGGLALPMAAAALLGLVRRARGSWVRAAVFALLLATLAGPRLERETRAGLPDVAVLVVDHTASMRVGARAALATAAEAAIRAQVAKLPGVELRTVEVPESGRDGTRLFAALEPALAGIGAQLSAVMAITDGQVHDGSAGTAPDTAPDAAPVHLLLAGAGEEHDRRLRLIQAPEYGVVGGEVLIKGIVEDLGDGPASPTARLTISRDAEPPLTQAVQVGVPWTVRLPIGREGPEVVEIAAEPWPGEASDLNNRASLTVNGVRERLRVLLVSGEPNPGERTWRRLLKADPAVDLVHFTILRTADKDDLTPLNELALIAFPTRELFQDKIGQFDLIVFDRVSNRGFLPLPYLRNVANYVRTGGALLVEVGPEFASPDSLDATPLRAVLPAHAWPEDTAIDGFGPGPDGPAGVRGGAFRPAVTATGARHPVTEGLEGAGRWGRWYRRMVPDRADASASAVAVMNAAADDAPLLLLDRVGRGRVAMLLSDQAWLWSRGHDGGGPQAELLRRVAHWLMRQPALEEERLTATLDAASTATLRVERHTLSDAPPPAVDVTAPDGVARRLRLSAVAGRPGVAEATMPAGQPGVWRVSDGAKTAFAAARLDNPREYADLRATATVMGPRALAGGGGVAWLAGADGGVRVPDLRRTEAGRRAAGDGWIGLPIRNAQRIVGHDAEPLLPPAALLPILLGALVLAWLSEAGPGKVGRSGVGRRAR